MTPTKIAVGDEKPLLISVSSLLGNLFTDKAFVVTYSLGRVNEIKTTSLLDTEAIDITFINLAMARHVYDVLKISFIQLAKPKSIRGFNGKSAPPITYAIYPTVMVQSHTKLLASFLITKLGQHPLILGKLWMQKHGVILDMSYDKLAFWPEHCQHPGSLLKAVNTLMELLPTTTSAHFSTSVYLGTSANISLTLHVDNPTTSATALAEPQKSKILKKLKKLKKSIEIPPAIPSIRPAYQRVNKLADSEEEKYIIPAKRIFQLAMTPKPAPSIDETKPLDLAFIGAAQFQYLAKQKDVKIFAFSMQDIKNELNTILIKDIKYQLNKMAKASTDPKTVISEECHRFLDVFLKEASDTLSAHLKYDHQIRLLEGYRDYDNSSLSKMSESKLQFVKKFLEEHLKKRFIKASNTLCSLHIMPAAKPRGRIRFCIDYRHLNELTKKDAYLIPLIKETMTQLKNAKVFTKIDIRQTFYKLRMTANLEGLTMFASQFGAFKWKVLPFGLTGESASWQHFINNVLWEYLNKFCTAYLDHILIYSSNLKKHKEHVQLMLANFVNLTSK